MKGRRKILAKALSSLANLRFAEMESLILASGFVLLRVTASHHICGRPGLAEQINLQNVGGKTNPFQGRQF